MPVNIPAIQQIRLSSMKDLDDIAFNTTPPMYGPELPEWWQLAIAGYEVMCHIPSDRVGINSSRWRPKHPPQLAADWFLVATGILSFPIHEDEDGLILRDNYDASFWVRRPPHVEGPTARTFVEVRRWAWADSGALVVLDGDDPWVEAPSTESRIAEIGGGVDESR